MPSKTFRPITQFAAAFLGLLSLLSSNSRAQEPAARIFTPIDDFDRVTLRGTHPPMARTENDTGPISSGTMLHGISIVLSRSAAQESDLQALIAAQQSPGSPQYHKWLSPDEFAARFGVADSDISLIKQWLEQQGLSFLGVSRSKNRIFVSGTTEQVKASFGVDIRYYTVNGEKHYAPSSDISVPTALSSLVQSVSNLSSFRPRPHVKLSKPRRAIQANFTSSQSGSHFLTPKDVATIYNLNSVYNAGYTGSGQAIAVVGQSAVVLSDIEHFQTAAGFSKKDPVLVLVPNSGTSAVVSGDEVESDLDLEYSSTVGKDATIYFVYVGNNSNYSLWDSIEHAVDNRVAPIISNSYGICETALTSSDYASLNAVLAQAAAQGQTIVTASGDSGSTDCYGVTGLTATQQKALAVDFPASSQYVTGMGGTEFSADDVSSSNTTYWKSASGSDVIGSALSYIPEQVWNDSSSTNGLASGGGGVSSFTARPSWQTGVPGIASGSYRLVPDISLDSSGDNAGYLYCSSDSATGVSGSCTNGFRDSNNTYLTVAGGTSFASPIFAGMLAIINQKLNSDGQGVINPILYTLAADSSTYSSAFHDITTGSNKCTAGSNYCSSAGASQYAAGTGYDQASGLGSVDFYNLLMAWPTSTSSGAASTTTLSAATITPSLGENDTITITVASASSSATTTPTGTLTIAVDGTRETSDLALTNGSAAYIFSSDVAGTHAITATYSGDSTYASSSGSLTLTVGGSSKTFTLAATNVTVSAGSSGSSIITITPQNGYTGTISWTVSSSPSLSNGCFSMSNATVSGSSPVTTTLTVYTNRSACTSSAAAATRGSELKFGVSTPVVFWNGANPPSAVNTLQAPFAMAGLLLVALLGFRNRKPGMLAGILLLAVVGLAVSGCGGSQSSSSSSNATKGTYTVTIVGTDTSSSSITASTTMTLTID